MELAKSATLTTTELAAKHPRLLKKMLEILSHLDQLKWDRKEAATGFKTQIKEAEKKISAISDALKSGDKTFLANAFESSEIDGLLR